MGIVLNAPISNLNLLAVTKVVDITVIITVVSEASDIAARLANGASILNVVAGPQTADLVRKIRAEFPDVPIIASGANAITYTPPSTAELFKHMMAKYRESETTFTPIRNLTSFHHYSILG